jgi:hypothetical protein
MQPEDSFRVRVVGGMRNGETAEDLYSRGNRFGAKNWTTLGLCLTAESDVSKINGWRHQRPI